LLTLPFGIAQGTKLRPVIHSGSFIGIEVPVWDIADNFGDTNLLVTNMAQANAAASPDALPPTRYSATDLDEDLSGRPSFGIGESPWHQL
jgi:hypothetical protein